MRLMLTDILLVLLQAKQPPTGGPAPAASAPAAAPTNAAPVVAGAGAKE